MTEDSKMKLPVFDGHDFPVWKQKMEAYLDLNNWLDIVLKKKPRHIHTLDASKNITVETQKAREVEIQQFEADDKRVRAKLLFALDTSQSRIVISCPTSKDIWDRLIALHQQRSKASKIGLQKEFFDLQMNKDEKIMDYIGRAEYLYKEMQDAEVGGLSEMVLVSKIVAGLPRRFINFMSAWSNLDEDDQNLVELIARLTAEDNLINRFRKLKVENALTTESRDDKGKKRSVRPHRRRPSKPNDNKCRNCQKDGHWARNCPDKPSTSKKSERKPKGKIETADLVEEEAVVVEEANLAQSHSNWIVDTGATSHMTYDRSDFVTYQTLDQPRNVLFGDKGSAIGIGEGVVKVTSIIEGRVVRLSLQKVLHVPNLRRKLFSIGVANSMGCVGEIAHNKIVLKNKSGSPILIANLVSGLYHAQIENHAQVFAASDVDPLTLLHGRFGHINKRYIVETSKVSEGLPKVDLQMIAKPNFGKAVDCQSCRLGKQWKLHLPLRSSPKSNEVGGVIHMDICEVGTLTLNDGKYFILFKDEYSNFRFLFIMKSRTQAYDCIRKVVARVEADTKQKVRYFMSDCGSEFTSGRTQEFLLQNKIVHRTSVPHLPAQNGVIERDNRTIMEGVRSMLAHRNVPLCLWGEAAHTFVYLVNRCVNSKTEGKTPFELYYGKQPKLGHLRVFGCLVFIKTPHKKRSGYQGKLEMRSVRAMFIGYTQDSMADYSYRIFYPEEKYIVSSHDVSFDEFKSYDDNTEVDYSPLDDAIHQLQVGDDDLTGQSSDSDDEPQEREALMTTFDQCLAVETNSAALGDVSITYRDATTNLDRDHWQKAMREEMDSLHKNKTWTLVSLPKERKPIGCKWVYRIKYKLDGSVDRYKARLCAQGFTQQKWLDYRETYSPVVRMESVRIMCALAAQYNLEMRQIDVKTAFLHGHLEEEIYMKQPPGFTASDPSLVCKLNKALYGLKQSSRSWNSCFTDFLKKFDLVPLASDTCVFISRKADLSSMNGDILIVCLYVDDGLLLSNSTSMLDKCIKHLQQKFEITVSEPNMFVGIQIDRSRQLGTLKLHQSLYLAKVLERFEMSNSQTSPIPIATHLRYCKTGVVDVESKHVDVPYRQAIGSLLYAALATRPDINYGVSLLARYSVAPRLSHWKAVKQVMRYLVDKLDHGITYTMQDKLTLSSYSDADLGGCEDSRKSTSGYIVCINNAPVIWRSTRQSLNSTSTVESEFIAAASLANEVIWIRNFLSELSIRLEPTKLYIDNLGAVRLIKNNQVHARTKSLDLKLFKVRDVNEKEVTVEHIPGKFQVADFLTKALPRERLESLLKKISFSGASREEVNLAEATMVGSKQAVLMLAVLASASEGFLVDEKYILEPHRHVLAFNHGCNVTVDSSMQQEMKQIQTHLYDEIASGKFTQCRSFKMYNYEMCLLRYSRLVNIIERFPDSVKIIFRRNVIHDIYAHAVPLASKIASSATNWILGSTKYGVVQTVVSMAFDLLKLQMIDLRSDYTEGSVVPQDFATNYLALVSKIVRERPNQVKSFYETFSGKRYATRYLEYASEKMSVAEVLLLSILDHLKEGFMDTQALGELVHDQLLAAVPINDTKVTKVTVEPNVVEFFFDVVHERSWYERIIWLDVLYSLILTSFFISVGVSIVMYWSKQNVERDIELYDRVLASVSSGTLNRSSTLGRTGKDRATTAGSSGAVGASAPASVDIYDIQGIEP